MDRKKIARPRRASAEAAAASRRNGARSRGPCTEEGKERSSQNAVRHGLRADHQPFSSEDEAWLQACAQQMHDHLQPESLQERELFEEMLVASVRLRRAEALLAARCEPVPAAFEAVRIPSKVPVQDIRAIVHAVIDVEVARARAMAKADGVADLGFYLGFDPIERTDAIIDDWSNGRQARKALIEEARRRRRLLPELGTLLHYEKRFRGQRDRALKQLSRAKGTAQSQSADAG